MNLQVEHPAKVKILNWGAILDQCSTIRRFCGRLDRFAEVIARCDESKPNQCYAESGKNASYLYKGDAFEIFCEILIKASPIDKRIGVSNYRPILVNEPPQFPEDEENIIVPDLGVDGVGVALDGATPMTVQAKYRARNHMLDAKKDHLNNFAYWSSAKYKAANYSQMLIITTGAGLHYRSDNYFDNKMRWIAFDRANNCLSSTRGPNELFSLKVLVDDNVVFWDLFRTLVGA